MARESRLAAARVRARQSGGCARRWARSSRPSRPVPTRPDPSRPIPTTAASHLCRCRKFTPLFAVTYEDQPDKSEVEVVFVSSDHDKEGFEEYYAEQPWAAVPFDAASKDALGEKFGVEGIPRVVVLSGADGSVVNGDARAAIVSKKSLAGLF